METSFERVWKRVKASEQYDEAEKLKEFILDEMNDAADYTRLARKTGLPHIRRLFASFAAEERRHAKKLQAAAFMHFGQNTVSADREKKNDEERMRGAVRRRYTTEQDRAEAYRAAAGNTSKDTLKKLYRELSEEEHRHAETLCSLLEEMM